MSPTASPPGPTEYQTQLLQMVSQLYETYPLSEPDTLLASILDLMRVHKTEAPLWKPGSLEKENPLALIRFLATVDIVLSHDYTTPFTTSEAELGPGRSAVEASENPVVPPLPRRAKTADMPLGTEVRVPGKGVGPRRTWRHFVPGQTGPDLSAAHSASRQGPRGLPLAQIKESEGPMPGSESPTAMQGSPQAQPGEGYGEASSTPVIPAMPKRRATITNIMRPTKKKTSDEFLMSYMESLAEARKKPDKILAPRSVEERRLAEQLAKDVAVPDSRILTSSSGDYVRWAMASEIVLLKSRSDNQYRLDHPDPGSAPPSVTWLRHQLLTLLYLSAEYTVSQFYAKDLELKALGELYKFVGTAAWSGPVQPLDIAHDKRRFRQAETEHFVDMAAVRRKSPKTGTLPPRDPDSDIATRAEEILSRLQELKPANVYLPSEGDLSFPEAILRAKRDRGYHAMLLLGVRPGVFDGKVGYWKPIVSYERAAQVLAAIWHDDPVMTGIMRRYNNYNEHEKEQPTPEDYQTLRRLWSEFKRCSDEIHRRFWTRVPPPMPIEPLTMPPTFASRPASSEVAVMESLLHFLRRKLDDSDRILAGAYGEQPLDHYIRMFRNRSRTFSMLVEALSAKRQRLIRHQEPTLRTAYGVSPSDGFDPLLSKLMRPPPPRPALEEHVFKTDPEDEDPALTDPTEPDLPEPASTKASASDDPPATPRNGDAPDRRLGPSGRNLALTVTGVLRMIREAYQEEQVSGSSGHQAMVLAPKMGII
ncbi:hypothetical protein CAUPRSCDRAFT_11785 [Caulochytrium protostelioides]|nr:hypothetical protein CAUPRSCDRAFT_11785 [Caulochytrium protostelioides]